PFYSAPRRLFLIPSALVAAPALQRKGNPPRCQAARPGPLQRNSLITGWSPTGRKSCTLADRYRQMGNDLDPVLCTVGLATAHRRPYASNSLAGCSPRTFRRQRARRSGSVRPSCSHSGNESRMGSACPAPWQRWLDQGGNPVSGGSPVSVHHSCPKRQTDTGFPLSIFSSIREDQTRPI